MQSTEHLMDRISEHLVTIQATRWLSVLHAWLTQYRGLYPAIAHDSTAPEQQILDLLSQYPHPVEDEVLSSALSHCDFLTWRARVGDRPWNPLQQSFQDFNDRGGAVVLWQSSKEFPEPATTQRWLLDQLNRHELIG